MKHGRSVLRSQQLAACPYPEPDKLGPTAYLISLRSILILYPHLCLALPTSSFLKISSQKPPPYVPHTPPILFYLVNAPEEKLANITNNAGLRYAVFSNIRLIPPS